MLLLLAVVFLNLLFLVWQQASVRLPVTYAAASTFDRRLPLQSQTTPDEALVAAAHSAAAATKGIVILTFVRWDQADLLANYVAHLRTAGMLQALVAIAVDEAALAMLRDHGIASQRLALPSEEGEVVDTDRPGSHMRDIASRLQAARWRSLATLVQAGMRVWLSDLRVLWQRPPAPAGSAEDATMVAEGCEVAFAKAAPAPAGEASAAAESAEDAPGSEAALHPSVALGLYGGGARTVQWLARLQRPGGSEAGVPALLRREARRCAGARRGGAREGAEPSDCPRWCVLSSATFPNGLATFQQPMLLRAEGAFGGASSAVAARPAAPAKPVALVADWVPPARLEFRLREARLWKANATGSGSAVASSKALAAASGGAPRAGAARGGVARGGAARGGGFGAPGERRTERFLAYKELLINNGLSNARNALRAALAVATLTNRTLILPPFWSRHLEGEPYRVGADYYFDLERLLRAFPRVRESALLERAFPRAATWPPEPPLPLFFVRLSDGEGLCAEVRDTAQLEALGNVAATCPPLELPQAQLRSMRARRFHLGASSDELAAWLAPHAHEPLLYFGRMFRRFHRFADGAQEAAFRRRYAEGVQPAPEIRAAAARALRALREAVAGDGTFDCVHMRRRDFVADHAQDEVSVEQYAATAAAKLRAWRRKGSKHKKRHGGKQLAEAGIEGGGDPAVYLASDVAGTPEAQAAFRSQGLTVYSLESVFPRDELDTFSATPALSRADGAARARAMASEMRFGNVDQLVCSEAANFVGNLWSSFTHHVCYLRQQRGVPGACSGSDIYGREIDKDMDYV